MNYGFRATQHDCPTGVKSTTDYGYPAKGKPLSAEVGAWNSAFLFAALPPVEGDVQSDAEHRLCLTLDGWSGVAHPAPGNATNRFREMEAACEAIAQRWPRIEPPDNAILG